MIINLILIGQDNSKNSNTRNFPLFLQYLTFRAPLIEMIILGIFIHRIEFSEKRDAETEKSLPFHHREWKKILYRSNSIKIVSGAHSSINYISFFFENVLLKVKAFSVIHAHSGLISNSFAEFNIIIFKLASICNSCSR